MAFILNIETSTKNCSVSLAKNGELVGFKEVNDGNYSHAEQLHYLISELCKEVHLNIANIDAIAVSKGPGSYTGLRIGVSAAKGLCFALDKPLISIDTLSSLAYPFQNKDGIVIPILDARRMEVYSAVYNTNHHQIRETRAEIIEPNSYLNYLEDEKVFFVGDAVLKTKEVIKHKNALFIENIFPSAKQMVKLSYIKYKKNDTEDVAYFEPFYLKDFIVIPEKKKRLLP